MTETDSEITITAPPPSNLDDISRINTPNSLASAPRGLMSRENTNLSGVPRVDTVPELSEGKHAGLTEPWSVGQGENVMNSKNEQVIPVEYQDGEGTIAIPEDNETANKTDEEPTIKDSKIDHLEIPSSVSVGGQPPHIDTDQFSTASAYVDDDPVPIEKGRLDYMQKAEPDLSNAYEDVVVQEEPNDELENSPEEVDQVNQGGAPPQINEDQLDDVDDQNFEVPGSAYKPLQPALINQEHQGIADLIVNGGDNDLLDRFDVTEETLKDELKEELEKFKE